MLLPAPVAFMYNQPADNEILNCAVVVSLDVAVFPVRSEKTADAKEPKNAKDEVISKGNRSAEMSVFVNYVLRSH